MKLGGGGGGGGGQRFRSRAVHAVHNLRNSLLLLLLLVAALACAETQVRFSQISSAKSINVFLIILYKCLVMTSVFLKSFNSHVFQDPAQKDEPDTVPGPPVWSDRSSLQQVVAKPLMSKVQDISILNIFPNAIKFRCSLRARRPEIQRLIFDG